LAATPAKTPYATGTLSRAAQRLLNTVASQNLRRKLGTNPGREVELAVIARREARLGISSSRSTSSSPRRIRSSSAASETPRRGVSTASVATASPLIRVRLTKQETGADSCASYDLRVIGQLYRGSVRCIEQDGVAMLINDISLEDYMKGLAEEPDTEPYEKQRAFAIAARTYAAWYMDPRERKFPGMPYDGSDSPAQFQAYGGIGFEERNPRWVRAVMRTDGRVLTVDGGLIKPPYFSSDDGRTRSPEEIGWGTFPFAHVFQSKPDPWCSGMENRGHGVGMSGCGAEGQANEGKTAEQILEYYYPGTIIQRIP
jgi:peptidoglycan hydrolase-like amidase